MRFYWIPTNYVFEQKKRQIMYTCTPANSSFRFSYKWNLRGSKLYRHAFVLQYIVSDGHEQTVDPDRTRPLAMRYAPKTNPSLPTPTRLVWGTTINLVLLESEFSRWFGSIRPRQTICPILMAITLVRPKGNSSGDEGAFGYAKMLVIF